MTRLPLVKLLLGVAAILPYAKSANSKPTPVVLWHGMGDSCCNPDSMGQVKQTLVEELPGVYVHSIMIGKSEDEDRKASYFDQINRQVQQVCEQLKSDSNLKDGFNAIGFSQGGQFLRAYVERCNDPPMHNLITFGSQHAGVSEWPGCRDRNDFSCSLARSLLLRGAYLSWVQSRVVQAQYYKDAKNYETYLVKNIFLPDINNEREYKNSTYATNLKSLKKFVMLMFEDDDMVVPKQSAWFGYWNEEGIVVPLREQPLYKEDWLGLKEMDKANKLVFDTIPGRHMQIELAYLRDEIIPKYLGGERRLVFQVDPAWK
ncbi:palmitoyl[protein] hydrolase [Spizellomyces sp. 'palustris']|nr:palmitoyl[protein] hydrolase [Spizellomyces sp. 'palustris']